MEEELLVSRLTLNIQIILIVLLVAFKKIYHLSIYLSIYLSIIIIYPSVYIFCSTFILIKQSLSSLWYSTVYWNGKYWVWWSKHHDLSSDHSAHWREINAFGFCSEFPWTCLIWASSWEKKLLSCAERVQFLSLQNSGSDSNPRNFSKILPTFKAFWEKICQTPQGKCLSTAMPWAVSLQTKVALNTHFKDVITISMKKRCIVSFL